MTREEMLNAAQGQQRPQVRMNVAKRVRTKEVEEKNAEGFVKKTPAFFWQDVIEKEGEKKEYVDKFTASPITGFFIGEAMLAEAFEDSIGKNGGTVRSTPYFNNNHIVLYAPNEKQPVFKGTMEAAESWAGANLSSKKLNKRKLFYIATEKGVVEITTNMSLAIDQTNKLGEAKKGSLISLTPTLYDPQDKSIDKKTHEYLGKFASKNKPVYCKIAVVRPMAEEDWAKYGVDDALANFVEWKNAKLGNQQTERPDVPAAEPIPSSHVPKSEGFHGAAAKQEESWQATSSADDGLPF